MFTLASTVEILIILGCFPSTKILFYFSTHSINQPGVLCLCLCSNAVPSSPSIPTLSGMCWDGPFWYRCLLIPPPYSWPIIYSLNFSFVRALLGNITLGKNVKNVKCIFEDIWYASFIHKLPRWITSSLYNVHLFRAVWPDTDPKHCGVFYYILFLLLYLILSFIATRTWRQNRLLQHFSTNLVIRYFNIRHVMSGDTD